MSSQGAQRRADLLHITNKPLDCHVLIDRDARSSVSQGDVEEGPAVPLGKKKPSPSGRGQGEGIILTYCYAGIILISGVLIEFVNEKQATVYSGFFHRIGYAFSVPINCEVR
jgi:hypothetical protein